MGKKVSFSLVHGKHLKTLAYILMCQVNHVSLFLVHIEILTFVSTDFNKQNGQKEQ